MRTNTSFNDATVVHNFDSPDLGVPTISPDGKSIAISIQDHIWLMDADGQNL